MAGSWTTERFPQFEAQVRRLVEQHRQIEGEPLHLALCYCPEREQDDIFLLEVIETPYQDGSDRDLFEVTFQSTPSFPMEPDGRLHLILTSPPEMETALAEQWPLAVELVAALRAGDYAILHSDDAGRRVLEMIEADAAVAEAVRG